MVEPVAMAVFRHVAIDEPDFLTVHGRIALRDRAFAVAQGFHLGSGEQDPRLEPLLDEIIEARTPVFGDDLLLVEGLRERLGHDWLRPALHVRARHRPHAWRYRTLPPTAAASPAGSHYGFA